MARAHPGALPEGELAETVLAEWRACSGSSSSCWVLTRVDEGVATRTHHDVDLDDLALAEARRVVRSGLDVDTLRSRSRPAER